MDLRPINDAEYCRHFLVDMTAHDERADRALDGYDTLVHSLNVLTSVVANLPLRVQKHIAKEITTRRPTTSNSTL